MTIQLTQWKSSFDRKLLVTAIGSSIIRMVPPLILTKEDCDKAFAILKETVEAQ